MAILQLVITALEAMGEACGLKKPKTAEEMERQRIFRRNERAAKLCMAALLFIFLGLQLRRFVMRY